VINTEHRPVYFFLLVLGVFEGVRNSANLIRNSANLGGFCFLLFFIIIFVFCF
jgi:hypothetical protein